MKKLVSIEKNIYFYCYVQYFRINIALTYFSFLLIFFFLVYSFYLSFLLLYICSMIVALALMCNSSFNCGKNLQVNIFIFFNNSSFLFLCRYVKVYLLPDKTKGGKRKTKTKKNTLSPVFNELLRVII